MKRTTLTSNPKTARAWQDRSRENARGRARETRREPIGKRKGQRRVVHPFPIPTPGERITEADVRTELHAFGVQAELCRKTMCAACFAVQTWRATTWGGPVDWTQLPSFTVRTSVPHHEPHRGLKGESLDRDTMPLCPAHHTEGNGDTVRHRLRSDARDAAAFYSLLPFDWRDVIREMRRRTALITKPVVDATASEKNP